MTPSSNRGTSPYHRFIPSEEVEKVSAWEFAPVDGSQVKPEPEAVAEEAPTTVPAEALEEVRQAAYHDGFEQGKLAGAQEARQALEPVVQKEVQQQAHRVSQLLQKLQTDSDRLDDTLANQLLELACDLARQVVRRELATPVEPLRAVVQEALSLAVQDGRPATLRLHPQDAALLQEGLGDALADTRVKVQADASLTPGGCVLESTQGAVDATVEKRWARAVANLGLQAPWNPGEQADV